MSSTLNARTRRVVADLVSGKPLTLGGKVVKSLQPGEARLLALLAGHLSELSADRGGELARNVCDHFANITEEGLDASAMPPEAFCPPSGWRLDAVRACSFRGLAPAECEWHHEMVGRSHLLYGPNGSGKSSLLGAISWCLTEHTFRDDRPPAPPEEITVYTTAKKATVAGARSDALTLTDQSGVSTPFTQEYWVEIRFTGVADDGLPCVLWLRRHSATGLASSPDGSVWTTIASIDEAGISELDAELHLLMPARVPYIRFGKDSDLVPLFAQVVGLDDLEQITELAGKVHTAALKEITRIEQAELAPLTDRISALLIQMEQASPGPVRAFPSFSPVFAPGRTLADVEAFGKDVAALIDRSRAQLAKDLGIDLSQDGSAAGDVVRDQLNNLPGHVQSAVEELAKDLAAVFPMSVGLQMPATEEIDALTQELATFEQSARSRASERLQWAIRTTGDVRTELMLTAARHFPEGASTCPVCTQDLRKVPAVREQLAELRAFAEHKHLHQEIDGLELTLLSELEALIPSDLRRLPDRSLSACIRRDWSVLKDGRFPGLLRAIADKFDSQIEALANQCELGDVAALQAIGASYQTELPGAFQSLNAALTDAHKYIRFVRGFHHHAPGIATTLTRLLRGDTSPLGGESICDILHRGRSVNGQLGVLEAIRQDARSLHAIEKEKGIRAEQIRRYRELAAAAEGPKSLTNAVRQEVIDVMKTVEPQVKAHYESLYSDERLVFDMVTTGHAANPKVRNELNVYLRAGAERIPVGPYANGGRLRALTLSFVFALLEQAGGSLNFLVLDDPALSLDDEHKSRLLDCIVRPLLQKQQIILATHYETFFKLADPIFFQHERLQLTPQRTPRDAVAFEPADLLQRFEEAMRSSSCSWREVGINLRRWTERVLHTLSGYCPHPFVRFNDIPGSVTAYAAIMDPRVATDARDRIIAALQSPQFTRIMHRIAHDENPSDTEAKDAFEALKKCRKDADGEIARFKQLFQHELLGRAIEHRPAFDLLAVTATIRTASLKIEGAAAAARNGVGVKWAEHEVSELNGYTVVLAKCDTLAPTVMAGQYILLDPEDALPENEDLAVLQTASGEKYIRRFWRDAQGFYLQSSHPTVAYAPVHIRSGLCLARRIVGVLFCGPARCPTGGEAEEWICPGSAPPDLFRGVFGVRVVGTSMEPVARDGQLVLVRRQELTEKIPNGTLACVDIEDVGAVIKRCYPRDPEWTLCPLNPVDIEAPMYVAPESIRHVYPLVGVLFKIPAVSV